MTTTTPPVTNAQLKALIDQGVTDALVARDADRSQNGDDSHNSGIGSKRTEQIARECTYTDFIKCQPLNFKGTEGVAGLSQWFEKWSLFSISLVMMPLMELALLCGRMFPKESDKIEKYVSGFPDMIHGSVVASKPKTMQDAVEITTELMDKRVRTFAECQTESKRKFEDTSRNTQNQQQPNKRQNTGKAYDVRSGEKKPYGGSKPLCPKCNYYHDGPCAPKCHKCNRVGHLARDCRSTTNANPTNNQRGTGAGAYRSFVSTAFSSLIDIIPIALDYGVDVELADSRIHYVNTLIWGCTLNFLNHPFNIDLMPIEMGSFDVIISMGWLSKYHAVIVCTEKIVRIPWGNETLIVCGDGSSDEHGSRLNIISCTKTQKYFLQGCQVFLAHVTTKKAEDKSKEK
ncbi:putative reverse transcriptase domain-containing protein [Tanacetum coccineum]